MTLSTWESTLLKDSPTSADLLHVVGIWLRVEIVEVGAALINAPLELVLLSFDRRLCWSLSRREERQDAAAVEQET